MPAVNAEAIDVLMKSFSKKFSLKAKAVSYVILVPITSVAFIYILDISEAQQKYFIPIIILVIIFSVANSKITYPRIMKRFNGYLKRVKAGESIDEAEMALVRKNFSRIPLYLAIDGGLRWALGLFLVAIGLRVIAPLTTTSLVTFFTIGFSNAFLGFLLCYIVSLSLLKEVGPHTVYAEISTKSFQLLNQLSNSLTIIVVVIILFIASILTAVVYNITYNSMQHEFKAHMVNINNIADRNIEKSIDDIAFACTFAIKEDLSAGAKIKAEQLKKVIDAIPAVDNLFILDREKAVASSAKAFNENALRANTVFAAAIAKAENGKTSLSGITLFPDDKHSAVLLAVPVSGKNIICIQLNPDMFFSPQVKGITIGKSGYLFIADTASRLIGHPDAELINTDLLTYSWGHLLAESKNGDFVRYEWNGRFKLFTLIRNEKYNYVIASSAYFSDMESSAFTTTQTLIIIMLAGSFGLGFVIFIIIRRNLAYIHTIQKTIYSMAKGDISAKLQVTTADEIGAISADLNTFIEKLRSVVESIKAMSSEFASSSDEMSATTLSFSDNAQSQAASAEEITATVEELSAGMDSISVGANDQNERLAGLIAEMGNLSTIITNMGNTIQKALRTTETMSDNARAGDESLRSMNTIMAEITQSSKDMTGIVKIITDISTQINLLSLNAAIEAARAGESGRGFAVVADEISKLADETASSIKDIDRLISENNDRIGKGMSSVTVSIETISSIIESTNAIADMMKTIGDLMQNQALLNSRVNTEADKVKDNAESIKHATEEHKIAITDIVRSIGSINELTQSNAGGSEEMASNAKDLSNSAEALKNAIDFFKL